MTNRGPVAGTVEAQQAGDKGIGLLSGELWDWFRSIAIALLLVLLMNFFVLTQAKVEGRSMQPTLLEGERLLVNRLAYAWTGPKRGDVIVLHDPDPARAADYLVKRVAAIAGDSVQLRQGVLLVNGHEVKESYTDIPAQDGDVGPYRIADGFLFVLGDNRHRGESRDSRSFGAVPNDRVIGKATAVIWPFAHMGGL